jgi:hypothetical protein
MQNQLHILQAAAVATGNGTAVAIKQPQNYAFATLLLQVEGITSATITVEGTLDNDTWYTLTVVNQAGTVATTITADGMYWVHVSGLYAARARISTWVSGTITVTGGLSEAPGSLYHTNAIASLAAGDNNIGNVDVLTIAAGDNNIGNVDIVTLPALAAGTNSIGGTTDKGPHWTSVFGVSGAVVTSADATGIVSVTDAPTAGQKLVITDIVMSSDTALRLDFLIETTGTILASFYLAANSSWQFTPRSKLKLATADKKLQVDASVAGNIRVTVFYYSEA